jgi:hypothetical protein
MSEKVDFQNLLRRVGNIEQLAGIRRISYTSGRRDGIRAFEVYNAAGLQVRKISLNSGKNLKAVFYDQ